MTPPDYRTLCAEKIEMALRSISGGLCYFTAEAKHAQLQDAEKALHEARALLAAPEAVGVTDEVIEAVAQVIYGSMRFDRINSTPSWENSFAQDEARRCARAVFARYAHPAPGPVSERPILKSSNFNDAQGHCWCGTKASVDESGDLPVNYPMAWELREPCAQDDCVMPHWALPLPKAHP